MKIGKPQRICTIEPVEDPVRHEEPPAEPRKAPSEPAVPETTPSR